jgi:DNA-directed RNA polymerase sigma subunit (sigma70/sigma32)
MLSLDYLLTRGSDETRTLADTVPDPEAVSPEAALDRDSTGAVLRAAIAALPQHEADLIRRRYLEGATLADIAGKERSRQGVHQMQRQALGHLRKHLHREGFREAADLL